MMCRWYHLVLLISATLSSCIIAQSIKKGELVDNIDFLEPKIHLNKIPSWINQYIEWHKVESENFLANPDDSTQKLLIIACHNPGRCGGVSNRLKSIPFFVLLAHKTNRLLFIKWQKFNLEDFLLPNLLNWTLPSFIDIGNSVHNNESSELTDAFFDPNHELHSHDKLIVKSLRDLYPNVENYFKSRHPSKYYAYAQIIDIFFKPSPPLANILFQEMNRLKLRPKEYISAHFRSTDITYRHDKIQQKYITYPDKNIYQIKSLVNCVIKVSGGNATKYPVYFTASDTKYVQYMIHSNFPNPQVNIVGIDSVIRFHSEKPIFGYQWDQHDPGDLYPTFVDLWMLKLSKCVSYGVLGFGAFAARISASDCTIRYMNAKCPKYLG